MNKWAWSTRNNLLFCSQSCSGRSTVMKRADGEAACLEFNAHFLSTEFVSDANVLVLHFVLVF